MIFSLEGSLSLNAHNNSTSNDQNSGHSPHLVIHGLDNSPGKFLVETPANLTRLGLLISVGDDPFALIRHAVNTMKKFIKK